MLANAGVTGTYLDYVSACFAPADYAPEHIVAVDIASEGLLPPEAEAYRGRTELCIDHHPSNERYAQHLCLDAGAAACGEIVYELCREGLGVMDGEIACALYVAIATDCGCFAYSNTTPRTHRIAAALMEYGDFAAGVNKRCFQTRSRKRLELESRLLTGARFTEEGQIALGAVSLRDLAEVGATEGDAS